jgi:CzcA family heavy metal efflux pump
MWLVRIALKRPYTFIVMAMLIVIIGVVSLTRMPTDIFPDIDIPVITAVWAYTGLPPEEMERRIVTNYERALTTTVNDIEHIESQSLTGMAVVKIFFQPGADIDAATAQVTAISQTVIRSMPPGAAPPLVIRYSASNVPVLQLGLGSDSLSEQQLFDLGVNFVRADIATVRGTQIPWPFGGKQRQIVVDLDPQRLYAWGLSPRDVTSALGLQNVILPTGSAKMGTSEYPIVLNSSPELLEEIGNLPIRNQAGTPVYIRDIATVRDGFSPQTSMVHIDGKRSVLMSILKNGNASTLDVVEAVKSMLPDTLARLPKELDARMLFDQSLFVRAAVDGVVHEAMIAAGLTALMILLFLGSWQSTFIVVLSIPLSILVSISVLYAIGHTLNVMTLGGLALSVGILVDDATVAIENIHRNMHQNKPFLRAIVDGAQEVAVPAFVATLCICIVFVPVAFIAGAARSLFVPLALAVVFAMLMSYVLSRTLVPTLVRLMLRPREGEKPRDNMFTRIVGAFDRGFERMRHGYGRWLGFALAHRASFTVSFLAFVVASSMLFPIIGRDFFPNVDAGLIKLHVRGRPGTRIEESEYRVAQVVDRIRQIIPADQIETLLDNIGTPVSGINLSLSEGALISSADAQIMISLKDGHDPTINYVREMRRELPRAFPETTFFFLAPDISTQVLNFGLAAPINVQVTGAPANDAATRQVAKDIAARMQTIEGAVDVHLAQVTEVPQLNIDVNRTMAAQAGLTQRDIASDVLGSLSSSSQTAPTYWLDRKRGVQYLVSVQTPQYHNDSFDALDAIPLSTGAASAPQRLSNVGQVSRSVGPANITHYNAGRTYDVQANVDGTDLGSVVDDVNALLDELKPKFPRGTNVRVLGQADSMQSSFRGLGYGLIFAVLLVYLLMVVNFQSWLDPFVILTALPGAVAGIAWMLFLTGTTVSVPALMGSIMCVGVATANSILVVTFANSQRETGRDATQAALAAGMTRLRPVLMTAFAMIIGMVPMSLGLGEGGEQNAPLGRAVVGGLLLATATTLFFVPVMYSVLRRKPPRVDRELEELT